MKLKELRSQNFYNLVVTFDEEAWENEKYEMDKSRFLEYTENNIKSTYNLLDDKAIENLTRMPSLFLYELGKKNYGYIGYITDIKVRTKNIGFKFKRFDKISMHDIEKLIFELDINESHRSITELQRTHWAIKKVNLIKELQESGINLSPALSKPKVFISYSWDSTDTQDKVKFLVEQLESDGVEVIYDRNSLHLGHDITFFMEKLSNDPTIKKVLVICDESYTQKANFRRSGVGTETEIITSIVYGSPSQNKIIPVFFEKTEDNKVIVPTFLKNRLGVDLASGNEKVGYDILLENIFS